MIKGLYRSGSAMIPRIRQQETIANNLANASTPGFKKDAVFTQELTRAEARHRPRRTDWETPMIDQVYTNYDQGNFDKTGNELDLAIEGAGFFVIEGEDGTPELTRAGNFEVDSAGYIVNPEGKRLLSEGGPINVTGNSAVTVSESGEVEVDNNIVSTIRVVNVEDPTQLEKIGDYSYVLPDGVDPIQASGYYVRQGYLEDSNVDVVKQMVEMIIAFRNYEASANSLKVQDESLEKLINNVGRAV
jgi:flagellar basal-body rod protein FlgF